MCIRAACLVKESLLKFELLECFYMKAMAFQSFHYSHGDISFFSRQ